MNAISKTFALIRVHSWLEPFLYTGGIDTSFTAETVTKHYGGVCALQDAHFSLRRGEVHALIGENGAGKSTLARILAGATTADRARISIDGQRGRHRHPLDAQRLGIGIIYQELDLFPNLTVGENIVIGNLHFRERGWSIPRMERVLPAVSRAGRARLRRPATAVESLSIGAAAAARHRARAQHERAHPAHGRAHQFAVRRCGGAALRG